MEFLNFFMDSKKNNYRYECDNNKLYLITNAIITESRMKFLSLPYLFNQLLIYSWTRVVYASINLSEWFSFSIREKTIISYFYSLVSNNLIIKKLIINWSRYTNNSSENPYESLIYHDVTRKFLYIHTISYHIRIFQYLKQQLPNRNRFYPHFPSIEIRDEYYDCNQALNFTRSHTLRN